MKEEGKAGLALTKDKRRLSLTGMLLFPDIPGVGTAGMELYCMLEVGVVEKDLVM